MDGQPANPWQFGIRSLLIQVGFLAVVMGLAIAVMRGQIAPDSGVVYGWIISALAAAASRGVVRYLWLGLIAASFLAIVFAFDPIQ